MDLHSRGQFARRMQERVNVAAERDVWQHAAALMQSHAGAPAARAAQPATWRPPARL